VRTPSTLFGNAGFNTQPEAPRLTYFEFALEGGAGDAGGAGADAEGAGADAEGAGADAEGADAA